MRRFERFLMGPFSSVLLLLLAMVLTPARAQPATWPNKPVRVVVPFAAGGSTDIIARVITARLSQEYNQQFIVDNRGGAGGSTGAEIAVRANPDGYTLIIVATSYATNAALYPLAYDPVKAITPVAQLHSGPFLVTLNNGVAANGIREFIDLLRSRPGTLNFASSGIGGATHLATELFMQMTGATAIHVPYKGDAPAMADLIGGQIQFILSSVPGVIQHVRGGKVKALAVTTATRWPDLPDLPALAEFVPGYEHTSWNGMWGPAGMPKDIANRLNMTLARLLKQPGVQERLKADGRAPAHTSPEEFARIIEREIGKWRKVVKAGNIKVN